MVRGHKRERASNELGTSDAHVRSNPSIFRKSFGYPHEKLPTTTAWFYGSWHLYFYHRVPELTGLDLITIKKIHSPLGKLPALLRAKSYNGPIVSRHIDDRVVVSG